MPAPGALAAAGAAFVDVDAAASVADDADALGAAAGALEELAAEGGVALDRVAAVGGAALAAAGALPMLTSGVILLTVAAETPALLQKRRPSRGRSLKNMVVQLKRDPLLFIRLRTLLNSTVAVSILFSVACALFAKKTP
jgi:hypothetical protein